MFVNWGSGRATCPLCGKRIETTEFQVTYQGYRQSARNHLGCLVKQAEFLVERGFPNPLQKVADIAGADGWDGYRVLAEMKEIVERRQRERENSTKPCITDSEDQGKKLQESGL